MWIAYCRTCKPKRVFGVTTVGNGLFGFSHRLEDGTVHGDFGYLELPADEGKDWDEGRESADAVMARLGKEYQDQLE